MRIIWGCRQVHHVSGWSQICLIPPSVRISCSAGWPLANISNEKLLMSPQALQKSIKWFLAEDPSHYYVQVLLLLWLLLLSFLNCLMCCWNCDESLLDSRLMIYDIIFTVCTLWKSLQILGLGTEWSDADAEKQKKRSQDWSPNYTCFSVGCSDDLQHIFPWHFSSATGLKILILTANLIGLKFLLGICWTKKTKKCVSLLIFTSYVVFFLIRKQKHILFWNFSKVCTYSVMSVTYSITVISSIQPTMKK